ncbi:matrixin family metalloprotease [uncultured Bifidobacterium sp.]|uniref:matrixin family metalloprotease n=1 Tax=uncultured Bifidobacterium sp. TaxID=165187 RepID=UPI002597428F|nr:matrixin family metalloprotease [uncultured Bifidobacterium sp.]
MSVAKKRLGFSFISMWLVVVGCLLLSSPAHAYTYSGSRFSSKSTTVTVNELMTGNYVTAINQAASDINSNTDVTFYTSNTGASWSALTQNYGATGWEGQSTWSYGVSGYTSLASSKINTYYIPSNTPVAQMRVLWLHELSHVWGLGHSNINTVMYTSASAAYRNGVRYLTSDDINGYNSLY